MPKYIQKEINDFIFEIIDNNNLELKKHYKSIHTVYRILEISKGGFCYLYKHREQTAPYHDDFKLVFDLFSKVDDNDKERIKYFCYEKSEDLKSNKLDEILNKEFFDK